MTDTQHLDQALLAIFHHGDWQSATAHMTDDQREAAAEAVQRAGDDSPGVRWWAFPRPTGRERIERLAELLGCPAPPELTPEEDRQVKAWLDECDRQTEEFYAHPERRATRGPLVLPPYPTLRSGDGR